MGEGTKAMLFSVGITGALLGGMALWSSHNRSERLTSGPGQLESIVVASAKRPLWLALESLEFSSEDSDETVYRLSVYEPTSGKLLSRKQEVPWRSCATAGEGLLWCHLQEAEVEVISLPGLEVVHGAAEVKQKVGQRLMDASRLETTPEGGLLSVLADGRRVQVEPRSLALSPAPAPERARPPLQPGKAFAGLQFCKLDGGEREGLCRYESGNRQARLDRAEGWLRPGRTEIEGLEDWLVLLTHDSLDTTVSSKQVVVLDARLEPRLTVRVTSGDPTLQRSLWLPDSQTLLLAFGAPADQTIALDLATGAERFRIKH